jgi:hypothetical protein
MTAGIKRILATAVAAAAFALGHAAHAADETTIADAIDRLQLTPQQLLSLQEFFGQFGRDDKAFGTTSSDGTTVLDLRDPQTNQSVGELIMRPNGDGSVSVARLSGAAQFDAAHLVVLPLFADAKKRNEIAAALSASAAGTPPALTTAAVMPPAPLPFLQTQKLLRVVPVSDPSDESQNQISQAQATFFPDGSVFANGVRATVVATDAPKGTRVPTLHVFGRYLSKLESDGLRIFRAKTVELAGDVGMSFNDFETKLACDVPGHCSALWGTIAPAFVSSLHVMRHANVTVPRAPLDLITALAPPIQQPAQAVLTPPTANQVPATAVIVPPSQPAVSTPPIAQPTQTTSSQSQQSPGQPVPQRDEIGNALAGSSAPDPGNH